MSAKKYLNQIYDELNRATRRYGPMTSPHEAYGIIKEEVDEMWDEIKQNNYLRARDEALQVAAMCVRFLVDSEEWEREKEGVQDGKRTD